MREARGATTMQWAFSRYMRPELFDEAVRLRDEEQRYLFVREAGDGEHVRAREETAACVIGGADAVFVPSRMGGRCVYAFLEGRLTAIARAEAVLVIPPDRVKRSHPREVCDCCGAHGEIVVCARCCDARYCGKACQRRHWRAHKAACVEKPPAKRAFYKAFMALARDPAKTDALHAAFKDTRTHAALWYHESGRFVFLSEAVCPTPQQADVELFYLVCPTENYVVCVGCK